MMASTDEAKIIRTLERMTSNKASFAGLAEALGGKWTPEMVRAKAEALDREESSAVFVVRGGVQYFGVETCRDPGLYKVVRRGIERKWAASESIPRPQVEPTFKLSTKLGPWTRPDFVISSQRVIGGVPVTQFHAVEVERHAGFDIRSVYQAYEQGRGAHFSWVFFAGPIKPEDEWARIKVAAKDCGVGLVHTPRPSAPAGWKTLLRAKLATPKPADLNGFRTRCGLFA